MAKGLGLLDLWGGGKVRQHHCRVHLLQGGPLVQNCMRKTRGTGSSESKRGGGDGDLLVGCRLALSNIFDRQRSDGKPSKAQEGGMIGKECGRKLDPGGCLGLVHIRGPQEMGGCIAPLASIPCEFPPQPTSVQTPPAQQTSNS